jgi:hypothetical protein
MERRLAALEPGRCVIVTIGGEEDGWQEPPADEQERRIAIAEQEAGPNGDVIVVRYVHDWRGETGEP